MNTYNFVHLTLHALGGQVRGKTKLQKMVYFAGILTGAIEELGYRPHYYGPYSSEVTDAMGRFAGWVSSSKRGQRRNHRSFWVRSCPLRFHFERTGQENRRGQSPRTS